MSNSNWLLPEYIQDILPDEAWRIERMRTEVLELLRLSGYQLVVPPLLEYAESLLVNGSRDMDLLTFKLVDQLSGRTLALRADITPQVARIDAHLLNPDGQNLFLLQTGKKPIQHPSFAPPVHAGVNGVPVPEMWGQPPPFTAVFHHVEEGVKQL